MFIQLCALASDKCGTESQCLAVDQYVAAAVEAQPAATSVFVTTEATSVEQEVNRFTQEASSPVRILTNHHDVQLDTGFLTDSSSTKELGDVIPAAVSSIQAQFRTSFVLGNCCSNFHLLMKDFIDIGCGVAEHFQCLQTHSNEAFRICCSWDKDCQLSPP